MNDDIKDLLDGLKDLLAESVPKRKPKKKVFSAKHETPEFQEFWATWKPYARHTDGRAVARDAFLRLSEDGASQRDMVDGAKCFFRTMKEKDREYVPLAATWLRRGAYEDLAIQERQHQQRISEAQTRRVEQIKQQAQEPASAQIDPERRAQLAAMAKAASTSMRMN